MSDAVACFSAACVGSENQHTNLKTHKKQAARQMHYKLMFIHSQKRPKIGKFLEECSTHRLRLLARLQPYKILNSQNNSKFTLCMLTK